ncbi:MAG: NADH-quinone oxidoreductase subunit NuoK [Dehalococcoidia bacterium]|mgnify:FL=1|nr:NADH-quinone oxidoreductase subunit NuoK [Dehalococcoidia bacterium]MBS20089.1 NADH-quinone oxidoreductase subunit NuoK [Chloroflexota bacterium]|tara:strand:+ start:698 stop:1054 length:357 start_codon:yes stop_codon:yes gene_type:complete
MTLENFLILGAILFGIGLYGALSKKHAISILMSLELMFNGINITAVAFSRYTIPTALTNDSLVESTSNAANFVLTGHIFSIFVITVAAAEVALGLAIIIAVYRSLQTILITETAELKK